MAADVSDPRLKTHHLSGQLKGLHAYSVGYDCRIVFAWQKHPKTGAEVLLLVNVGSHEEVYLTRGRSWRLWCERWDSIWLQFNWTRTFTISFRNKRRMAS